MDYNKPFDQSNPDAPYTNGNPGASIPGSIPPAEALEFPQREIVRAIKDAGQTASNADLAQLSKAIRRPLFSLDTGSVNAVVLTIPNWAHTEGRMVLARVGAGNTNTGPVTVTIAPEVAKPLTYPDGAAIMAGELPAGRNFEMLTTPTAFVLVSPAIKISTNYYTYLQSQIGTEFFYSNLGAVPDVALDSGPNASTNTLIGEVSLPAGFINMFATVTVSVGQSGTTTAASAYQVNIWASEDSGPWIRLEWSDLTKPAGIQTVQLNRSAFRSLDKTKPYRIRTTIWKTADTGVATPPQSSLQVQALRI